jgi:hypothetical protein
MVSTLLNTSATGHIAVVRRRPVALSCTLAFTSTQTHGIAVLQPDQTWASSAQSRRPAGLRSVTASMSPWPRAAPRRRGSAATAGSQGSYSDAVATVDSRGNAVNLQRHECVLPEVWTQSLLNSYKPVSPHVFDLTSAPSDDCISILILLVERDSPVPNQRHMHILLEYG